MLRRAVVLTIIGLAACAGDQPTEPTFEGEAGGFLAAPPPAPAPPTVLTGELGGGTGLGVSTELGFWESPVYATVTVDGALGYSGRPDGYLPGTGEIDAAGILVQSQCDLTVYVSFATSSGGATLPIAPTCWYPARNMGSYSRRMTLQGRVWTYRTAGPPLSCYKGVTPCVSYTGTQSVTVTPEEGHLILTPNKTVVAPGGGIYVTAKAVWTGDEKTAVPLTVREWRWVGSGAEVGGGHTKVCAIYNTNQCIVSVYQSGNVILEALVNGKVKTEQVWIAVQGGDTLPPLPPDSLPGGGGDGDGGDGDGGGDDGSGGGGCGTCCGDSTGTGPQTAACQPPDPPTALVECRGPSGTSDIVRGQVVDCSVVVTPDQAFSVDGWQAIPDGGGPQSFPGAMHLTGPAVVSTEVSATVTLLDGTALTATPARYSVIARGWAKLQLPSSPPRLHSRTFDPYGEMTPLPIQGASFVLGLFALATVDFTLVRTEKVAQGPNTGYAYFLAPPSLPIPEVYTHPGLGSGPWYDDQNGTGAGNCTPAILPTLEGKVQVHEGMTQVQESHWGIAHELFEFSQLTPAWEALVDPNGSETGIQSTAQGQYNAMASRMWASQQMFDQLDYPRIFNSLGCTLDMDPSQADR